MNIEKSIWIGLLHIKTKSKNNVLLPNVSGAYVNVIAKVDSKEELIFILKNYVKKQYWIFIDIEEVEPLYIRLKTYDVAKQIIKKTKLLVNKGDFCFGTFHTY